MAESGLCERGSMPLGTRAVVSGAAISRKYKNGQNREVPEAGSKLYLSLILGLNGAAKSHFGPILGPLGRQYTFLGFKNVDSWLRSTVIASISSPVFRKKWRAVPYTS